jgi:hypothetical protein
VFGWQKLSARLAPAAPAGVQSAERQAVALRRSLHQSVCSHSTTTSRRPILHDDVRDRPVIALRRAGSARQPHGRALPDGPTVAENPQPGSENPRPRSPLEKIPNPLMARDAIWCFCP